MKKIFLFAALFISTNLLAQTTTYILVRHAEKDTTVQGSTMMQADPPLTKQGEARAQKLVKMLQEFEVDEIYSTNYIRTKSTVTPLAEKYQLDIQNYNARDLKDFANKLLQTKNKTIVIAGHSNTTPALVNLLIGKEEYKPLDESVYNKIYMVIIKDGESKVRVIEY
ncbi:MAG: histidine phosphatase family protein [Chitinophagaceae bacterium]|jgi:broad specificity phosphatase PhoE|nr:histidine phosphatase family protein [Chitinophagaceae bacterium]